MVFHPGLLLSIVVSDFQEGKTQCISTFQASACVTFVSVTLTKAKHMESTPWKDPLEEGIATHSSILPWRLSWTEEPGRLQSIGSHRVGHD